MSNFQFLESHWTDLAKLGDLSEKYVYSDPNTSIIKQGMLSEVMVKYMLAYDGIAEPAYDNTHAFKNKGGYNAVNKAFGQKLDEFIDEINGYMYSA